MKAIGKFKVGLYALCGIAMILFSLLRRSKEDVLKPDGEDKLYFMTRDFSAVLNRIQERTDVPFGEWWTGSPGKFKPNALWIDGVEYDYRRTGCINSDPNAVFEESPDYMNGNGLFIQGSVR